MGSGLVGKRCLTHPVDVVEQLASAHNWQFERITEGELLVCVEGVFSSYDVAFSWIEDYEALHISCAFPVAVGQKRQNELHGLLSQINGKMLIGHFAYCADSAAIIYRQSLLLSGGLCPSDTQVEMLLLHSIEACESHHHLFQMVSTSKISAGKAMRYALFETIGNA